MGIKKSLILVAALGFLVIIVFWQVITYFPELLPTPELGELDPSSFLSLDSITLAAIATVALIVIAAIVAFKLRKRRGRKKDRTSLPSLEKMETEEEGFSSLFEALPGLDANADSAAIESVKEDAEGWERDTDVEEPEEN